MESADRHNWWRLIKELQNDPRIVMDREGVSETAIVEDTAIITGPVYFGDNVKIDHFAIIQGPVYISDDVIIGTYAQIRPGTWIGRNATIGSRSEIKSCVVGHYVKIGPRNQFGDSYIDDETFTGGFASVTNMMLQKPKGRTVTVKFKDGTIHDTGLKKLGCYIGQGAMVGARSVIYPGRIVEPGSLHPPYSIIK